MRTKKSAYTAPQPKANGTKGGRKYTSPPVQQFHLTNDMVHVSVEDEEEPYENTDMLTYQDNEEDLDFDPSDDVVEEGPKRKRGRPSKNNNSVDETKKRGRKPTLKAAEAAAFAAAKAKSASNSPTKKAQPPPPQPQPVTTPKKRGRQPKAATTPAVPINVNTAPTVTPAAAVTPMLVSPVPSGVTIPAAFGVAPTPNTTPAAATAPGSSAPRFNYLKPQQPPPGAGVSEARLKEVEAQFALELEKATRNHNMVVANLREEFASKLHAMKAEWDAEKTKIWETLGRAQVKKEV